jgi:hypothetical protein
VAAARGRPQAFTRATWRRIQAGILVAVVLAAHALATRWLAHQIVALDTRPARMIQPMQAAYVRELRPEQPPAAQPPVRRAPRPAARKRPVQAAAPASAPAAAEAASQPQAEPLAVASAASEAVPDPEPAASAPSATAGEPVAEAASAVAEAAASAPTEPVPSADSFAWPASTRIRYTLTGQFRGEVHGSAEVQWLRQGERYQVHLEAVIGPKFAPLGSRRMSSEGRTTVTGLQPERYEQETRMLLNEPRQLRMAFDAQSITLANGTRVLRTPGMGMDMEGAQDTASQFVQLVWLFRSQPQRLAVGQSVEFTLAFPRRVLRWTYVVVERTSVPTPAGDVEAFHVKPPRDATGGDWTTEMWFAPSLQYLPVRLLIRQDAQTYVDLAMEGLPEQAGR